MPKKTSPPLRQSASAKRVEPSEESSQHIWLAGLGAMAKAQSQGTKAFEGLIADGLAFQRQTEATQQLSHLAKDFGHQTSGRVDRLEHVFEDRVARALTRLGIPSMTDVEALTERVAALETHMAQTAKAPAKAVKRPAAKKPL